MELQPVLWSACAGALALAGFASWADRRRLKRSNPDAVGLMPWPLILMLSILAASMLAAIAIRGG